MSHIDAKFSAAGTSAPRPAPSGAPGFPPVQLDRMRRAIAASYPACRNGESCPCPAAGGCECHDNAARALQALMEADPALRTALTKAG